MGRRCRNSKTPFILSQLVPAASHPFIAKHARAGRDAQNGLGGVPDFKPGSQSDLLLLVALNLTN